MTEKGFYTPFKELLDEVVKQSSEPESSLDEGIEPPTNGLTVQCSTPELI